MENLKMPIVEYLDPTNDYKFHQFKLGSQLLPDGWIRVPEGAEIAVLYEPTITYSRYGELFFWKDNGDTHYMYSERSRCQRPTGWYSCKSNQITTLGEFLQSWAGQCRIIWRREQSDAIASPNNIARTAEDHREHNLANELNDLCAEFGCPPGADRMDWLRKQLRKAQSHADGFTTYQYAASINTARGTIQYDGVINLLGRITDIDDYQQARAEIAKDGNVAPEQVNVHSLSIVG